MIDLPKLDDHSLARLVVETIETRYKPLKVPEKPAVLWAQDAQKLLQAARDGNTALMDTARTFVNWREEVTRVEAQNIGRCETVMWAWRVLSPQSADWDPFFRRALKNFYGVDCEGPPDAFTAKDIAKRAGKRVEVLTVEERAA